MGLHFDAFLETKCICGNDQSVQMQTLEAAFAFHLSEEFRMESIELVHEWLPELVRAHGFRMSPGWTNRIGLDTRHVIGVSVARFQKA